MMPPVGKSGPGTICIRPASVIAGSSSSARQAVTISVRLCGGILVAMPTAIPEEPLTRRFGTRVNGSSDRKSTRLNSSHTEIYTLSLHDALPICDDLRQVVRGDIGRHADRDSRGAVDQEVWNPGQRLLRSEEHTSELQSHRDLHSFPTRRSSDL